MLRIKTEVRNSSIHGQGLYTLEDLEPGQVVWKFDPRYTLVIPKDNIDWITPEARKDLRTKHFCYVDSHGNYRMPLDDDKYVNHSDDPNLSDVSDNMTVAARFIRAGEELTSDYRKLVPASLFKEYFTG